MTIYEPVTPEQILTNQPLPAPAPPPPQPPIRPNVPAMSIRMRRHIQGRMRVDLPKKRELVRAVEQLLALDAPPSIEDACRKVGVKFNSFRRWRRLFKVRPRSENEIKQAAMRMAHARAARKVAPIREHKAATSSPIPERKVHDADFIGKVVARVIRELNI